MVSWPLASAIANSAHSALLHRTNFAIAISESLPAAWRVDIPSPKENRRVQHDVGCLKLKHQTPRALEHKGDCPDVLPQSKQEFAFVRVSGNTLAEEHS
jgi:hypothetical protein